MPRKNLAKMAAALNACIELHGIGELDDDLLPVRSLSDEESDSEEDETEPDGGERKKAGTKKRKRVYERKVTSQPRLKTRLLRDSPISMFHNMLPESVGRCNDRMRIVFDISDVVVIALENTQWRKTNFFKFLLCKRESTCKLAI